MSHLCCCGETVEQDLRMPPAEQHSVQGRPAQSKWPFFHAVARFFGWWAGLFGFIAAGGGSVCPCCGTTGCPVAPIAAGMLGGVVAALLYLPRWFRSLWNARVSRKRQPS